VAHSRLDGSPSSEGHLVHAMDKSVLFTGGKVCEPGLRALVLSVPDTPRRNDKIMTME
jgi:hypothetical protein